MNKTHLTLILTTPIFTLPVFGLLINWMNIKNQQNKTAIINRAPETSAAFDAVRRAIIQKNVPQVYDHSRSTGLDEFGIKVPDIKSQQDRPHNKVLILEPLIDRGILKPFSERHNAKSKTKVNQNEWEEYLEKRDIALRERKKNNA